MIMERKIVLIDKFYVTEKEKKKTGPNKTFHIDYVFIEIFFCSHKLLECIPLCGKSHPVLSTDGTALKLIGPIESV